MWALRFNLNLEKHPMTGTSRCSIPAATSSRMQPRTTESTPRYGRRIGRKYFRNKVTKSLIYNKITNTLTKGVRQKRLVPLVVGEAVLAGTQAHVWATSGIKNSNIRIIGQEVDAIKKYTRLGSEVFNNTRNSLVSWWRWWIDWKQTWSVSMKHKNRSRSASSCHAKQNTIFETIIQISWILMMVSGGKLCRHHSMPPNSTNQRTVIVALCVLVTLLFKEPVAIVGF